jgi:hypothetical protein
MRAARCARLPQSDGDFRPGAGGTYLPMTLNSRPMKPSGVQLARPIFPPAPGLKSPSLWGNRAHLAALMGEKANLAMTSRTFAFRYKSPAHMIDIFRSYYGPMVKAFAAIDPPVRDALEADLHALIGEFNAAKDGALVIPSEYLEAVIIKKA